MFSPYLLSFLLIFMCQFSFVGNIWLSTSVSCPSKTERPPSLSLFPGGDGMVRGGLGGLEWFLQTSGIPAISADLSTPLATRCDSYDSTQNARGGVMISIILSDTPPLSLLVSRSGSWVVTSRPPRVHDFALFSNVFFLF